jgi:hypothetical protein
MIKECNKIPSSIGMLLEKFKMDKCDIHSSLFCKSKSHMGHSIGILTIIPRWQCNVSDSSLPTWQLFIQLVNTSRLTFIISKYLIQFIMRERMKKKGKAERKLSVPHKSLGFDVGTDNSIKRISWRLTV